MNKQPVSNIRTLATLHFSLLTGQVVFAAIAYYLRLSGHMPLVDLGNPVYVLQIFGGIALLLTVLAFAMYKKRLNAIRANSVATNEKLVSYRAANLVRWAMLEAPVLLGTIGFLISGNYNLLIVAGVVLLLFLTTRPTRSKAAEELQVAEGELNV